MHVYKEHRLDWDPPFWSVVIYLDEEGIERSSQEYYRDFDTADLRFMDRRPLGMYSIGQKCPECNHSEAMNKFRIGVLCCMSCGHEWKK